MVKAGTAGIGNMSNQLAGKIAADLFETPELILNHFRSRDI